MAYRIAYASAGKDRRESSLSWMRIFILSAAFFSLFLSLCLFWPKSRDFVGQLLFPGGAAPAMAAAETLVTELRSGEPIGDALEHFCQEVIRLADLP